MALSPFEIRLELLKLAKEVLINKYNHDRAGEENDYFTEREKYSYYLNNGNSVKKPDYPKTTYPVTEASITEMAEALNKFISMK